MKWLQLVLSLPTQNTTVRMRVWRNLKTIGAAVLRDGVYVLPVTASHEQAFCHIVNEVKNGGGVAYIFHIDDQDIVGLKSLFDRHEDYELLYVQLTSVRQQLSATTLDDSLKLVRKLRKTLNHIKAIDFFPQVIQQQVEDELNALEQQIMRYGESDEPVMQDGELSILDRKAYAGRRWATRQRPKVDRLASAWLIKRFIDPDATLIWLQHPDDCPEDALGFDFDGATFSHVNSYVTFETLIHRFDLQDEALNQLATVVHFLDVGGVQPLEAVGVETILLGLRMSITDDNQLLAAASMVFDGLLTRFAEKKNVD
jgi:hypothetical protein